MAKGPLGISLDISEALNVYNAYRAKIVAEDALISQRLNWLLAAETILFGFWGVIHTQGIQPSARGLSHGDVGCLFISVVGAILAKLCDESLEAARLEIDKVLFEYGAKYRDLCRVSSVVPRLYTTQPILEDQDLEPPLEFELDETNQGDWLSRYVPRIFLCLQIGLMVYVLFEAGAR